MAEETFGDVLPHLAEWGITRVADTTGLDRIGIPTAGAVRPGTPDGIWVYSGKAMTQDRARLVAVMECLERSHATWPARPPGSAVRAPIPGPAVGEAWPPSRFTERGSRTLGNAPILWLPARRENTDHEVWVPAQLVFNGIPPSWAGDLPFVTSTSNGLAAHRDAERAVLAGLLEVVERHVVSVLEIVASHGPYATLVEMVERLGLDSSVLDGFVDATDVAQTIDVETVPEDCRRIIDRCAANDLAVTVKSLPNSLGLPAYGVAAVEQTGFSEYLACAGYGVRLDHHGALLAALLELGQTRGTDLQGAREDRHHPEKRRITRQQRNHWLLTPGPAVPFPEEAVPAKPVTAAESTSTVLRRLAAAGYTDWACCWFDGPTGVSVCRVLVPGLETWHVTAGASSLGAEARLRLERREGVGDASRS